MRVPQSSIFIGFFILKHPASGVSPWNAPIFLGSRPGRSWGLSPAAEWWYPRSFLRPKSPMCRTKKNKFPTPNDGQPAPIPPYFDLLWAVSTGILEKTAFHPKTLWVSIITGRTWPSLRFLLVLYAHSCQFCNAVTQIWPWDIYIHLRKTDKESWASTANLPKLESPTNPWDGHAANTPGKEQGILEGSIFHLTCL